MSLRNLVYGLYERRLRAGLAGRALPHHVAVIIDGNRRWAKAMGFDDPSRGHLAGGQKIEQLLYWCDEAGIGHVTIYMLSTDNLNRPPEQLDPLLRVIETVVTELAAPDRPWRLHVAGALDTLPARTAEVLKAAEEHTAARTGGARVNVAVGYGGRQEIAEAVRSLLQQHAEAGTTIEELAELLDVDHIAEHLYTRGQPDPDLIIRTSGEQRLSGFLTWQSAHSEFYFCEAHWPEFRRTDFLRALRSYANRQRRYGA
ncbi:MAG: isoprenyl transferase [Actinocatenispora sp.]